jgi:hypothetical protein
MSTSYFDELVKLQCGPELLSLKLFPNAKEITESFGAFGAVRNYVCSESLKLEDPSIELFAVGDGVTPRTAATFAFRSNWTCHSIDPEMRMKEYPVRRLSIYRNKIEELNFLADGIAVIALVHSHAKIKDVLNHIHSKKERHLITIPCCVPHEIANTPYIGYMDTRILSEKNTVKIWKDI